MRLRNMLAVIGLGLIVLGLSACEDTVDPILESDRQFTIWGTLDMNADRQYVRVIPIRGKLDAGQTKNPEIAFHSFDLDTGAETTWRDSLIVFQDGTTGLIFTARLRVQPTHTYRLEVSTPESAFITSAETTIPPLPVAEVFPENVTRTTSSSGFAIKGSQRVVWSNINREPYLIEQWYRFLEFQNFEFVDTRLRFEPTNTYAPESNTLEFTLDLKRQKDSVATMVNLPQLILSGLGITVTVLDAAFDPPGGVFDPEILVQPGTLSNVERGFGFIGSVGRFSIEWMISNESARLLQYPNTTRPSGRLESGSSGIRTAQLRRSPWVADR